MSTKKSGTSWQDTISDWLVSIIVAVALAFCIRTFVVEPYMVEGTSMHSDAGKPRAPDRQQV